MKPNDIIEVKMPNGINVKAIAIAKIETIFDSDSYDDLISDYIWLGYAQNKLFRYYEYKKEYINSIIKPVIIIPEYDNILNKIQIIK